MMKNESIYVTAVSGFFPARSLDKLYNFADCAGLHLIFGLNALHRNPDNSWNASSALSLLKYSASKKYNISWELGNGESLPMQIHKLYFWYDISLWHGSLYFHVLMKEKGKHPSHQAMINFYAIV